MSVRVHSRDGIRARYTAILVSVCDLEPAIVRRSVGDGRHFAAGELDVRTCTNLFPCTLHAGVTVSRLMPVVDKCKYTCDAIQSACSV
jgi:hypothetical protein